ARHSMDKRTNDDEDRQLTRTFGGSKMLTSRHGKGAAIIVFLLALVLQADPTTSRAIGATTEPTTAPSFLDEYRVILDRAEAFNIEHPQINSWMMSTEHCFLTASKEDLSDLLRTLVISFVTRP